MYQEKVEFLTKNLEQLQETVLRQQENLQTTVEMIRLVSFRSQTAKNDRSQSPCVEATTDGASSPTIAFLNSSLQKARAEQQTPTSRGAGQSGSAAS